MRYLIMVISCLAASITALAQDENPTIKYVIDKNIFESNKKLFDIKYLTVSKTKDSLFFTTDKFLSLGGIPYSDTYLPDSVSSESSTSLKKTIISGGIKYTALVKGINKNGITEKFIVTIDNNEILNISSSKSYYCTNHGAVVHTCPTAPGSAHPPCGASDCSWKLDN